MSVVATVKSLVACSKHEGIERTLIPGLKFPTSQSDEINEVTFFSCASVNSSLESTMISTSEYGNISCRP